MAYTRQGDDIRALEEGRASIHLDPNRPDGTAVLIRIPEIPRYAPITDAASGNVIGRKQINEGVYSERRVDAATITHETQWYWRFCSKEQQEQLAVAPLITQAERERLNQMTTQGLTTFEREVLERRARLRK